MFDHSIHLGIHEAYVLAIFIFILITSKFIFCGIPFNIYIPQQSVLRWLQGRSLGFGFFFHHFKETILSISTFISPSSTQPKFHLLVFSSSFSNSSSSAYTLLHLNLIISMWRGPKLQYFPLIPSCEVKILFQTSNLHMKIHHHLYPLVKEWYLLHHRI